MFKFWKNKQSNSSSVNVNSKEAWILKSKYHHLSIYRCMRRYGIETYYVCKKYDDLYQNIYTGETEYRTIYYGNSITLIPTGKTEWEKISETENYEVQRLYTEYVISEFNIERWLWFESDAVERTIPKKSEDTK